MTASSNSDSIEGLTEQLGGVTTQLEQVELDLGENRNDIDNLLTTTGAHTENI